MEGHFSDTEEYIPYTHLQIGLFKSYKHIDTIRRILKTILSPIITQKEINANVYLKVKNHNNPTILLGYCLKEQRMCDIPWGLHHWDTHYTTSYEGERLLLANLKYNYLKLQKHIDRFTYLSKT